MQSTRPTSTSPRGAIAPARRIAFEILRRVEDGAHSTDLLRERTRGLDARDAGLTSELVLGTLRRRPQLDFLIRRFSGREVELDLEVRLALHLGIYQLRYLDRVPAHAALNESVELARWANKPAATGLVNAVLRKVDRTPVRWPNRATELCMPQWLLARWDGQLGRETTQRVAEAFLVPPETYIRVPAGAEPPLGAEATEIPGCYRVGLGRQTGFRVQDISSQSIVPRLELAPGHGFLDVCSAPGGKFAQALEALTAPTEEHVDHATTPASSPPLAVACDFSWKRLHDMEWTTGEGSVPAVRCVAEATRPLPFVRTFDRVLADVPCSGTGTLGRNPEIRWRLLPRDIEDFRNRQVRILSHALKLLAPGGRLVYSTCSLEPEENEAVVQEVVREFGAGLQLLQEHRRTPGVDAGDGFYAAVITSNEPAS